MQTRKIRMVGARAPAALISTDVDAAGDREKCEGS
jgi:hypothetical protein